MSCRNPNKPSICLCPPQGKGPRHVLEQKFINGWLGRELTRAANALASDANVSEERLWRMVATLEDEASGAYQMWSNSQ